LPQQIVLFSVIIYDFLPFFSLLISILPLRLATGKYIVKAGSENENTSGDEKDNPPVFHAGPLVDHMTGHHGSQQTHQIGHTIGDGDEKAGEAGGDIQVVDLEAGVDGSMLYLVNASIYVATIDICHAQLQLDSGESFGFALENCKLRFPASRSPLTPTSSHVNH